MSAALPSAAGWLCFQRPTWCCPLDYSLLEGCIQAEVLKGAQTPGTPEVTRWSRQVTHITSEAIVEPSHPHPLAGATIS